MSDDRSGIFRYVTDVRTRETGGCVERTGVVSDDEKSKRRDFFTLKVTDQSTEIIKPLRLAPPLRVRAQPSACSNLLVSLSSASHRRLRHR